MAFLIGYLHALFYGPRQTNGTWAVYHDAITHNKNMAGLGFGVVKLNEYKQGTLALVSTSKNEMFPLPVEIDSFIPEMTGC